MKSLLVHPPGPSRVDVLGELTDWRNPIALERRDDGSFAREIDVPVGVHQYKLVVDGAWRLDDACPRTRSSGGQRNSVLVIGGAPEPILFAPAEPWVTELARGGVRILAGARHGAPPPRVLYREGAREREDDAWIEVAATRAFDEDEHAFYCATLPTSAKRVELSVGGFETSWTRAPAAERAPAWLARAVLYTVFVDRFRPAEDHAGWTRDPGRGARAGGHLDGVRRSLDALVDLGVTAIYLTPVHVGASAHRYDLVDPLAVDPALGGEAAYDALASAARARGLRVVQDFSFAHAGRGFPAYEDVLAHGRASRFAPWFVWRDGALVHYGKRTDAPLLDLESAEVKALALEAASYWAKRGASALRLDMTAEVPIALGRAIRRRFRELVPDGAVIGEVVPEHAWRWRGGPEPVVDAATDFGFHGAITSLVVDRASPAETMARLARLDLVRGGDPAASAVRFASTHDHPRLATLAAAKGALDRLPLAYAMLATMPGVPMLLYGEEIAMRSDGAGLALEDVWPDRAPMRWSEREGGFFASFRELFRARAASEALSAGSFEVLFADDETLVYRRRAGDDVVDVALNFGAEAKTIALEDDEHPGLAPIVLTAGRVDGDAVTLPPGAAIVARRAPHAMPRARRNLAVQRSEFVAARETLTTRPTRFFFSVTERCNLRCAHCITHAPARTADGSARTITPAVLDALRDDFAFGEYFAFVHGGESLTSRALFDVLGAIRDARGEERWTAHLLSNGALLGPAIAERLVGAGVSSISVSLDGATAATNDAIRLGGSFDGITRRVREVAAWRAGDRVDLRLGLSFVVLAQNLGELDALVDLAARLGVDWVKLEEGVPATAFAARSLVACAAGDARAAIDRAVARGRAHGLVMVDHTPARALFRCRLDDEARAFLEADEFANRGDIHPCRTPWDTVCVEPNGDVRALDFFGPILGNAVATPLATLWNAPAAAAARARSRIARICGPSGPVVCV